MLLNENIIGIDNREEGDESQWDDDEKDGCIREEGAQQGQHAGGDEELAADLVGLVPNRITGERPGCQQ